MSRPGIHVEIPGFGPIAIHRLVTDYSGTLSCGGKLTGGVRERLFRLDELVEIHVLTSDTFGTVRFELANIPARIKILQDGGHDRQKEDYVSEQCAPESVAVFGNGRNDRLMLRVVRDAGGLAVAVDNGEGCAVGALQSANLFIHGAAAALDLLLESDRIKAGLRF